MESPPHVPFWKQEPESPPHLYEDAWLFGDGPLAADDDLTAFKSDPSDGDAPGSKAEAVSRLLEDLDHLGHLDDDFIKEEPFSTWLEEKVDLPIFDHIHIEPSRYLPARYPKHEDIKPAHNVPDNTTTFLLQEFEHVFGTVELTHGQLTPPQSPPLTPPVLTTLTTYYQPRAALEMAPGTPQPDVAHELAVVEELVRSRAENMVNSVDLPSKLTLVEPSSPCSSSSSGFSECSSDPEWIPEPVNDSGVDTSLVERSAKGRKRAGKPYSRVGPEDKKSRKKEQNKNAATRYRMKKKAEVEEILSEEKGLADVRSDLQGKVSDLQREIKCLKGLMRDLFRAKGLIE